MVWFLSIVFVLCLAVGIGRWRSSRPPIADRIRHAMDAEFTARVRKAKELPETTEFDFLFQVADHLQVDEFTSGLSSLGFSVQDAESTSEGILIGAKINAAPATIDFASYRQQFAGICSRLGVVYLGFGEASYKAAGINLSAVNYQNNVPSANQA